MLFNSPEFIFLFLPLVFLGYFAAVRANNRNAANVWLVLSSLLFYSWWKFEYLALLLASITCNFFLGRAIIGNRSKKTLGAGIALNVGLLGYFKYTDFFITNINYLTGSAIDTMGIVLPLAISFFTFQQIAYLVDCYKGDHHDYSFIEYMLFVSFFPQLIAGPIVHHREMMPQFKKDASEAVSWDSVSKGIFVFSLGLFKKVAIADTFAQWASAGFDWNMPYVYDPHFFDAWAVALSYTFQIYYDFSGYTDMAIGAALLFGINLPINFNSPYKALNVQDFWRRWHITLSRWLRNYVYIPLGGNRAGDMRTLANIFLTFLIGGIWHGAGWTFVLWGALHGAGLVIHRLWLKTGLRLPRFFSWLLTFLFVTVAWVFFRAETFADAERILKGMFMGNGVFVTEKFISLANIFLDIPVEMFTSVTTGSIATAYAYLFILIFGAATVLLPNTMEIIGKVDNYSGRFRFEKSVSNAMLAGAALGLGVLLLFITTGSEFLYFNF